MPIKQRNTNPNKNCKFIDWKIDTEKLSRLVTQIDESKLILRDELLSKRLTEFDFSRLQSPKFAPPIEFVDQATLSPPEGYKDGGLLDSALSGALGNHVFGAQHIQQLQVIQRLQQQRAAMLAARAAAANATSQPTTNPVVEPQAVCTECAECAECAAAKLAELEGGEPN